MDKKQWLAERQKGLGGSDSPCVLNVNPWKSRYDLWLDKTGQAPPVETNKAMERGKTLEPIVAKIYQEQTGRKTEIVDGILQDAEYPFMLGNLDRLIIGNGNGDGVLEIKTTNLRGWGKCKREGLPEYYMIQLQHYLGVTGLSWGSIAVFSAEQWEILTFDVERDNELIGIIYDEGAKFWRLVESGTPPDIEEIKLPDMPKVGADLIKVQDADWLRAAENLKQAKDILDEAKAIEEEAKAEIQKLMTAYNTDVAEGGNLRVYWRMQDGRKTFDKAAFAKDNPNIDLKKYEKQGSPFRVFKPYFIKGE